MTATRAGNDRALAGLYGGLLRVERARLLARAFRDADEPLYALLAATTPPEDVDAITDAVRILCRLRYPLSPMAESVLARAERDLARLVQAMFDGLLADLGRLFPGGAPAPAAEASDAAGAGEYSDRVLLAVFVALTAGSYTRVRRELAAIAEVVDGYRRDVFGGEDPLPRAVREFLEQAEETVAAFPALWARVAEGFAVDAGIGEMPALEEPDPAAITEEAATLRRILTLDGWMRPRPR